MNCGAQVAAAARRRPRRAGLRSPGEERYAGSKWGSAPSAAALPQPPTHWRREGRCRSEPDRALQLKLLLNVA